MNLLLNINMSSNCSWHNNKSTLHYQPPLYNSHLCTMATTLQLPLFWRTIHWLLFKPLYNGHFLLSPRWPLWRGSIIIVTHCIKQNTANVSSGKFRKKFPLVNCYIFLSNFPIFVSHKNNKFDTGLSHLCIQCTFPGPFRHTALFQDFLKSTMYLSMPIMYR